MIRDRAAALVRAVAGSLDDPFLVAELAREDIGRLADEAASLPLTGGRRVVRLREATDAAAEQVGADPEGQRAGAGGAGGAGPGDALAAAHAGRRRAGRRGDRLLSGGRPGAGRDDPRRADRGRRRHRCRRAGLAVATNWARIGSRPGRRWRSWRCMSGRAAGWTWTRRWRASAIWRVCRWTMRCSPRPRAMWRRADRALELAMAEGAAPVGVLRAGADAFAAAAPGAAGDGRRAAARPMR